MRILAFLALFAFLISGYSAAAGAFESSCHCPKGMTTHESMKDCCKHMNGKCGCTACIFNAVQALPQRPEILPLSVATRLVASPAAIAEAEMLYPGLRPPDVLA
jgi:hypothetical protein